MRRRTAIALSLGASVLVWLALWPVSCDGLRLSNPPIPLACTSLTGLHVPWQLALVAGLVTGALVGSVLMVGVRRAGRAS